MTTFGITKCDVPECKNEYTIQYNRSIPPNHPMDLWLTVGGYAICPDHNSKFKVIMEMLGLRVKWRISE
jgi:hypothetical protein